jgi:hypothetical protein
MKSINPLGWRAFLTRAYNKGIKKFFFASFA